MRLLSPHRPLRHAALLGLAAALLFAGRASADPYTYQVINSTLSGGDPLNPVTDDFTFNNILLTEIYTDGFSQTTALPSLNTGDIFEETPATLAANGHGILTSAFLSGQLGLDGFPLSDIIDTTLQQSPGGPTTDQYVSSYFTSSLFGPAPAGGIGVGTFSLLNGNDVVGPASAPIDVMPVPEASSAASLALLLVLALGGLAVSRRRRAAPAA